MSVKQLLVLLFTLLCCAKLFAEEPRVVSIDDYLFRADYLSINMPEEQSNLGLVGFHLDKKYHSGFYTGAGIYSAVAGQYDGFFALGGELGWEHLLYRQLGIDAGIFVGAGGGGAAIASQIGNGGFVLPYVGLFYHFPQITLGLNYSHIRFQSGQVSSQQAQLMIEWPFQLLAKHPLVFSDDQLVTFDWSKNYLAAVGGIYFPHASQFSDGSALTNNTELMGIEFGHFITQHFYNFFEFTGAVAGNPNGYANLFAGFGWQQAIAQSPFFYTGRLALGSGGGGGYDTGSGLLVYPSLGLGWQFAPHWQTEILSGYLSSIGGGYHALTGEFQLKHDFDIAVPGSHQTQALSDFDVQDWRIRFGDQLYINPQHENSQSNSNINLLALKIDHFLTPHWYVTGQTAFAYTGNAAGYFSGMLGGGYQTTVYRHTNLFAEGLLGTAGGANLDIHDGALAQLGVGLNYQWSPHFATYAELSKLSAFNGSFHPTTIDLGLSYSFGLLTMHGVSQ